jgi:membrane-bound inhibitor of C-type lysozyme
MKTIFCMAVALTIGLAAQPCSAKSQNYTCIDGTRLTASFHGSASTRGKVLLDFADRAGRLSLPQALSADGGRYSNGKTEFWIKGNAATLQRPNRLATTCSTALR